MQAMAEQVEAELQAEAREAEEEQRAAKAAIDTKKAELQGLEAARMQAVRPLPLLLPAESPPGVLCYIVSMQFVSITLKSCTVDDIQSSFETGTISGTTKVA